MTTQNMKFGSSICVWVLLISSAAFAQPAPSEGPSSATGPISGYMDFHFNKAKPRTACSTSIASCSSSITASRRGFASSASSSWSMRSSRGWRKRRARARTGVPRLPADACVQRPRGHAARADGHHQRAPRAAGVSRASSVRSSTRSSSRPRGLKTARAFTASSAAASGIARTSWRRSTRSSSRADEGIRERPAERLAVERPQRGLRGPRGVRRRSGPDAGRERLERQVEFPRAAARTSRFASERRTSDTSAIAWSCAASSRRSGSATPSASIVTAGQLTGVSPNIARDTARLLRRGGLSGVAAGRGARSRGASRATRTSTPSSGCPRATSR